MVEGARPRLRAIADIDSPRASPNKISSRSSALIRPGAGAHLSGTPTSLDVHTGRHQGQRAAEISGDLLQRQPLGLETAGHLLLLASHLTNTHLRDPKSTRLN